MEEPGAMKFKNSKKRHNYATNVKGKTWLEPKVDERN